MDSLWYNAVRRQEATASYGHQVWYDEDTNRSYMPWLTAAAMAILAHGLGSSKRPSTSLDVASTLTMARMLSLPAQLLPHFEYKHTKPEDVKETPERRKPHWICLTWREMSKNERRFTFSFSIRLEFLQSLLCNCKTVKSVLQNIDGQNAISYVKLAALMGNNRIATEVAKKRFPKKHEFGQLLFAAGCIGGLNGLARQHVGDAAVAMVITDVGQLDRSPLYYCLLNRKIRLAVDLIKEQRLPFELRALTPALESLDGSSIRYFLRLLREGRVLTPEQFFDSENDLYAYSLMDFIRRCAEGKYRYEALQAVATYGLCDCGTVLHEGYLSVVKKSLAAVDSRFLLARQHGQRTSGATDDGVTFTQLSKNGKTGKLLPHERRLLKLRHELLDVKTVFSWL